MKRIGWVLLAAMSFSIPQNVQSQNTSGDGYTWETNLPENDKVHYIGNRTLVKDEAGQHWRISAQKVTAWAKTTGVYAVYYLENPSRGGEWKKGLIKEGDFISEDQYNQIMTERANELRRQMEAQRAYREAAAARERQAAQNQTDDLRQQMRGGTVILHGTTPFGRQLEMDAIDEATTGRR